MKFARNKLKQNLILCLWKEVMAAVNGEGKGSRWFLNHRNDEGWTVCGERGMLRATARGARRKSGDSLMSQRLEQEQQLERKKS